jgi:hypothetical protein
VQGAPTVELNRVTSYTGGDYNIKTYE